MRSPTLVSRPIRGLRSWTSADVGGGAAHVEGDQVAVAALLGDPHRAGDAAGRAGQQHGDRGADRRVGRLQAAVAAQDRQLAGDAAVAQLVRRACWT